VFVDTDGSLITKLPGYTDPETFLYALQYVREEAYETTPFDQFIAARRTGLSLEQAMGDLVAPPREETEAQ
jgi:thioredoxin-related protein